MHGKYVENSTRLELRFRPGWRAGVTRAFRANNRIDATSESRDGGERRDDMSERDAGSFGPFFEIAGSGYAIDEPNTPEYRQMKYGWQSEWTMEEDGQERFARLKNPCVAYDLPESKRNASDVLEACERAVRGGKVTRCYVPEGEDFAFVTFARDEDAATLCERGLSFDDDENDDDGVRTNDDGENSERSTKSKKTYTVEALKIPGPALVGWRERGARQSDGGVSAHRQRARSIHRRIV